MSSETEREAAHAFFKEHAEWLEGSWSATPEGRKYKAEFDRHVATLARAAQAAEAGEAVLLRQALEALESHRDQTRPIERTTVAIAAIRARLEMN